MYVLLFTVFISFFKWTVAYRLMEQSKSAKTANNDLSGLILGEIATESSEIQGGKTISEPIVQLSRWQLIKKSLNPPVYAVILALPLALIPHVSSKLFLAGDSVFKDNAYAALEKIGGVTTVSILLILGQRLSKGYPPHCDITHWELWAAVLGRLVVMPFIGMGIFLGLYHRGFCVRGI